MSTKLSIDDIQDRFDSLVLTFFDCVRSELSQNRPASFNNVLEAYNSMLVAVEDLNGINSSAEVQVDKMAKLSEKYEQARARILDLEDKLKLIGSEVDNQLEENV
jgi:hypothetical protein